MFVWLPHSQAVDQTYVKHILQLAGEENLVDVETDSSYNNRPQPGCEAATQTFCPLVEQCTVCFYINKIFFPGQLKNVLHICLIVNHPLFVDIHHHVGQSVKPSL
jgi:hypothetical protein